MNCEILPSPTLDLPKESDSPWHREKDAFWAMFQDLKKNYKDKYVAIHDGKVVAIGDDIVDATLKALDTCGNVPMYIQCVSDEPQRTIKLRSSRIVKGA